ncbi:MAG: Crp/Fnr family transcriptional regulator [Xanthobacter sp.]
MKHVPLTEAWTGVADCKNCTIRNAVLFSGLKETDFDALHRPIDQFIYTPGMQIYAAGDEGRTLFTVRSGLVKLTQYLPDGTQRIVRLLRKTDLFGLEALVQPDYPHTATALHETELCRLPVDVVRDLSHTNDVLYQELMSRWHKALSSADRWITEFSTGSARDRVVRLLLWLCEPEDHARCTLFSREDLGALLGLTTETASRTMAELKRQNFIRETRTNQFECDISRLQQVLGG